ncbi:unnamed protein product [Dicrocoelium dendriticum]|nr:unnamed protein product [Dicrocoelium dendriticum]
MGVKSFRSQPTAFNVQFENFWLLSTNKVTSLEPFSHCSLLQELYLRGNNVQDIHEVAHLKNLSSLQKLWLEGNPCCTAVLSVLPEKLNSLELYRCTVLRNLIGLTYLDYTAVTSEERIQSQKCGLILTAPPPVNYDGGLDDATDQLCTSLELMDESVLETDLTETEKTLSEDETIQLENDADGTIGCEELDEGTHIQTPIPPTIEFSPALACGKHFNVPSAWMLETKKTRNGCRLKPRKKNKFTISSRRSHFPVGENERTVRSAVIALLKILNTRSLEMVIQAAERRLSRLDRVTRQLEYEPQSEPLPNGWDSTIEYDFTNYVDDQR